MSKPLPNLCQQWPFFAAFFKNLETKTCSWDMRTPLTALRSTGSSSIICEDRENERPVTLSALFVSGVVTVIAPDCCSNNLIFHVGNKIKNFLILSYHRMCSIFQGLKRPFTAQPLFAVWFCGLVNCHKSAAGAHLLWFDHFRTGFMGDKVTITPSMWLPIMLQWGVLRWIPTAPVP